MRAVLSADAVTMRVPSGLKVAEHTLHTCPRRTGISFSGATFVAVSVLRRVNPQDRQTGCWKNSVLHRLLQERAKINRSR
jgi:hypothetical protein